MKTYPLVSLDEVIDASASAKYTFGAPTFFRGAQPKEANQYWQSGQYGLISVTDGLGLTYLWI